MKRHLFGLILLMTFLVALGCTQGPTRPADMPPLYPCQIKVIQDGKPLEGAKVHLTADGASVRFTTAGVADKNGIAVIKTDIDWAGVPEGKFKVCVSKLLIPEADASQEMPKDPAEQLAYRKKLEDQSSPTKSVVDKKFLRPHTTPITIDVNKSGVNETVDVGAAVSELWDDVLGGRSGR